MSEKINQSLAGVSETLLITLYARARESQRPNTLLKDNQAEAMVHQLDCDFSRLRLQRHDEIALIMRARKFDSQVRGFLTRSPDAVVVHIGCGLDTRFERIDNGRLEWFDLDLPGVMELRQKLIPGANPRQHALAASMFDDTWLEEVEPYRPRPFLFLAEGVFPYFEEAQIKTLFLKLRDHFPGAEMICDAHTPFEIWANNLQLALTKVNARLHWSLRHGKDVESWGDGITLLEEWFYFEETDPRMGSFRWMRHFPLLGKSSGIFHYRLGSRPTP